LEGTTTTFNSNYNIIDGIWKEGVIMLNTIVNMYCFVSLREKILVWKEVTGQKITVQETFVHCG